MEIKEESKQDIMVSDNIRARLSQALIIRILQDTLLYSAAAYGTDLYVLTMGLHLALRDPDMFKKLVEATKDIVKATDDATTQRMFGHEEWAKTN